MSVDATPLPPQAQCSNELKRRVLAGRYTLPDSISADGKDLVRWLSNSSSSRALAVTCAARPLHFQYTRFGSVLSLHVCVARRFVTRCAALLSVLQIRQMLTLSPERRISIPGIQQHRWLHRVARQQLDSSVHRGAVGGAQDWENCELDADVLQQLEECGLDPKVVERSVRAQEYNHESACYDMLAARSRTDPASVAARSQKAS